MAKVALVLVVCVLAAGVSLGHAAAGALGGVSVALGNVAHGTQAR